MDAPRTPETPTFPDLGLVLVGGPGPATTWPESASWFAALEADGCRALWFTDHLFFPHDTPEALVMAGVAASATTVCHVGTGVLQMPLRHVATTARAAATVATLAPRRFILGLGAGEREDEFTLAGAQFRGRGAVFDAGIDRLRDLWAQRSGPCALRPCPDDLPIWIGGRSMGAVERAARRADGWFPMFVSPEGFARRRAALTEAMQECGRAESDLTRAVLLLVAPGRGRLSATRAVEWAASVFRAPAEAISQKIIFGTAAECVRRFDEYRDAGAQHVAVLPAGVDPRRAFATILEAT